MKTKANSTDNILESMRLSNVHKMIATTQNFIAKPTTIQRVHCPTCGSYAERIYHKDAVRTQCSKCDYLMAICVKTGRVVEAYAPSFSPAAVSMTA